MKEYISPIAKAINIQAESLLATSGDIDNDKKDGVMGGSNRRNNIWGDEN